jgi:hypothetical protein
MLILEVPLYMYTVKVGVWCAMSATESIGSAYSEITYSHRYDTHILTQHWPLLKRGPTQFFSYLVQATLHVF